MEAEGRVAEQEDGSGPEDGEITERWRERRKGRNDNKNINNDDDDDDDDAEIGNKCHTDDEKGEKR